MVSFSEEFERTITPVIVAFILYSIVGFFGNIVVIFVYGTRYPKNRFRCLVLALGLVDLTSCCTTVPMETASTWYWFNAPSRGLCKAKNFFVQFTGLSAMYMLFVTAAYKYRQICRPFKRQFTIKVILILCCIGIFVSFACAVPAAVIWDINNHTVEIDNESEFAMICEVCGKYHDTLIPTMYRSLLSAYDLFLLATIVLYVFVGKATFIHFRKTKRREQSTQNRPCSLISTAAKNKFQGDRVDSEDSSPCTTETSKDNTSSGPESDFSTIPDKTNPKLPETPFVSVVPSGRQSQPIDIRKVLIMVIIAGVFSVTFLMALTFGYVFAIRDYKDYKSVGELIALFCCYRFYFINYCLNPIVYFSLDTRFRKEVFQLFPCLK